MLWGWASKWSVTMWIKNLQDVYDPKSVLFLGLFSSLRAYLWSHFQGFLDWRQRRNMAREFEDFVPKHNLTTSPLNPVLFIKLCIYGGYIQEAIIIIIIIKGLMLCDI